ncbi:hypothetical protein H0A65_15115 [Alcaligenaceae bacterium]|nr:hypothetical protein [Alcaligenaceae bacterium]
MKKSRQADQDEPFFITDGTPSNDLPISPHRTMSLPEILADLTDEELAKWPRDLAGTELERRRKTERE